MELKEIIERAWNNRELLHERNTEIAIRTVIEELDKGVRRVAEPKENGELSHKKQIYLIDMAIGENGDVVGVKETSPLFLRYLDKIGVNIGTHVEIIDKIEFDQSLEIKVNNERTIIISKEIAQNVYTLE